MIPAGFEPLGLQLGRIASIAGLAAALVVGVSGVVAIRPRSEELGFGLGAIGFIGLFFAGIVFVIAAIPFRAAYWQDYRVTGHVVAVSNTWTEDGGDMARVPVVTLDTVPRPVVIDDPRAIALEGADVVLTCTVEWHWRAADTFACRIVEVA